MTLLLNFGSLKHYPQHFVSFNQFFTDLSQQNLPDLSFLEPSGVGVPNDYHPSDGSNSVANHSSILAGEVLLANIYDAIKNTPQSYRKNILFVITFDESGGTYDHVPPPSATPPDNTASGEMNFGFNRLGVRVPMIWINDYIQYGTTVQQQLQHTSFMRLLRTLWNIPGHLTNRDNTAPDVNLSKVFGNTLRSSWPTVTPRNTYNPPGNASNPKVDEFSFYLDSLKSTFDQWLNNVECDLDRFFGIGCPNISWASTLSFSPIWFLIALLFSYYLA